YEGLIRNRNPRVEFDTLLGDLHFFNALGQGIVENRRMCRSHKPAELLDERGRADRLRPARFDRMNSYCNCIALFRTFNRYRSALWIEEGHVEKRGRTIRLLLYLAFEGILRLGDDDVARFDMQNRF